MLSPELLPLHMVFPVSLVAKEVKDKTFWVACDAHSGKPLGTYTSREMAQDAGAIDWLQGMEAVYSAAATLAPGSLHDLKECLSCVQEFASLLQEDKTQDGNIDLKVHIRRSEAPEMQPGQQKFVVRVKELLLQAVKGQMPTADDAQANLHIRSIHDGLGDAAELKALKKGLEIVLADQTGCNESGREEHYQGLAAALAAAAFACEQQGDSASADEAHWLLWLLRRHRERSSGSAPLPATASEALEHVSVILVSHLCLYTVQAAQGAQGLGGTDPQAVDLSEASHGIRELAQDCEICIVGLLQLAPIRHLLSSPGWLAVSKLRQYLHSQTVSQGQLPLVDFMKNCDVRREVEALLGGEGYVGVMANHVWTENDNGYVRRRAQMAASQIDPEKTTLSEVARLWPSLLDNLWREHLDIPQSESLHSTLSSQRDAVTIAQHVHAVIEVLRKEKQVEQSQLEQLLPEGNVFIAGKVTLQLDELKAPKDAKVASSRELMQRAWDESECLRLAVLQDLSDLVTDVGKLMPAEFMLNAPDPPDRSMYEANCDRLDDKARDIVVRAQRVASLLRSCGRHRDAQLFVYAPSVADILQEAWRTVKLAQDNFGLA